MAGQKNKLPRAVVRRFIKYLRLVQQKRNADAEWVSSREIADALELTSSTVRQDLSHLNYSGTPKYGYQAAELEAVLRKFLKADERCEVILVGAGNLGKALIQHQEFERQGYSICAIYDKDPKVIGTKVGTRIIRDVADVTVDVTKHGWKMAMLAVPAAASQELAEQLIEAGIKGFLNLSLAHIITPEYVSVVDARLIASLQELVFAVSEQAFLNEQEE